MNQVLQETSPKSTNTTDYQTSTAKTHEVYYQESDGKPMAETEIHIQVITDLLQTLRRYFENSDDVHVSADIRFYYEEGNPKKFIAPDILVTKGVDKKLRRVFKLWEEKTPSVIFEISSRGTFREDFNRKWSIYQKIGVKEYYVFDAEYNYLDKSLVAYRLEDEELNEVETVDGRIFSEELGLEIVDTGETLRLFDPKTNGFLRTSQEMENALREAETEIAKLRALLENKAQ